ncbi:tyrosine--tRNA ligase [Frondihabitans australicus]|uniref:Tyrosine--tRNA ligase n=1 Tax=Frondihabitans australicus TaxID=386892 RepID=A0A495IEN1_9MICO|nr:tyrosine--tRNA ligase [Frondihabitans australicus]RKR74457.1 tyrosyl-tRNA synthetase [Frondihabitans australicus]
MTSQTTADILATQSNDPTFDNVWDEIVYRGLVHVSTDTEALRELLGGEPITYYCGFDPTAPSLHLGNLVQLLLLRRLQLAGHRPLGLVGGSTGLIGDPRPTAERVLKTREQTAEWVERIRVHVTKFIASDGANALRVVNNLDWTEPMSAIEFLRDIGKNFRVNTMLKKDAVSARLNSDAGISYTEFSYQILQGLDFRELYRTYDCVLQTGGSDQWGNLTSGTELIRRTEGVSVHAIGTPLITNSDGTKFGKSEGNAIWLDPDMTSPYAFYQFWLNQDDSDVIDRLKVFTFLSRAEIEGLEVEVKERPFAREAQKRLALEVTSLVHGTDATQAAIDASSALFGRGDLTALPLDVVDAAIAELPNATVDATTTVSQAMVATGLVESLGAARRAAAEGGVYVNNERVSDESVAISTLALAGGRAILRRGKKTLAGVTIVG